MALTSHPLKPKQHDSVAEGGIRSKKTAFHAKRLEIDMMPLADVLGGGRLKDFSQAILGEGAKLECPHESGCCGMDGVPGSRVHRVEAQ
jgi:hypothetical protein